jgi:uroporphyrinogen decarboxylase
MRLIEACRLRNRSGPPLWIMRQAGRYLPEYRDLRARHSFVEMCTRPDLAVEASLQPYRRFGFDAVIVFYDILFLAAAMGAPLEFTEEGPVFRQPVRREEDIRALHEPAIRAADPKEGTGAILESIRRLRAEVPPGTAVLGFAGAPFTVAAYLVEGSFGRTGDRMRRLIHEDPRAAHALLERLAHATAGYAAAQAEAGADAVQLFDTWAGILSAEEFREFALPYERAVLEKLAEAGTPSILYAKDSAHLLDDLPHGGAGVLSLDWRQPLAEARRRLGPGIGLQGNLDPALLFAPPAEVRRRTEALLESLRGDPGYIANLGHGILPETPLAGVEALVEAVRTHGDAES